MNEVKPDRILQVGCGFMGSKLLFLANEVRIFEQLAGRPATLDELTQRIGMPGRTMRIPTDAMVALCLWKTTAENTTTARQPSAP